MLKIDQEDETDDLKDYSNAWQIAANNGNDTY